MECLFFANCFWCRINRIVGLRWYYCKQAIIKLSHHYHRLHDTISNYYIRHGQNFYKFWWDFLLKNLIENKNLAGTRKVTGEQQMVGCCSAGRESSSLQHCGELLGLTTLIIQTLQGGHTANTTPTAARTASEVTAPFIFLFWFDPFYPPSHPH